MKLTQAVLISACLALADAKALQAPRATINKIEEPTTVEAVEPEYVKPEALTDEVAEEVVPEVIETASPEIDTVDVQVVPEPEVDPAVAEAEALAEEEARIKAEEDARIQAEEEAYAAAVAERWEYVHEINYFARAIWTGMFQGIYGMSMTAEKPTEDCFGKWVPESMNEMTTWAYNVRYDWKKLDYAATETVAYDWVDLTFRNDEYCHFRQTFWDIHDFCQLEGNCEDILGNMQTNAFSIITQLSSSLAAMKAKPWGELEKEQKGYVMNTMGKSIA